MARTNVSHGKLFVAAVLLVAAALPIALSSSARAASLTQVYVRFDRMQTSQGTTGTVCAMPATTATEASVQVTFPTGYTVTTTSLATNWAVSTTNLAWPTGGTAWPGIGSAATGASGQVVTFSSTDLSVGTLYCFNWTATTGVSISGSASTTNSGTVTTRDSGPSTIDTANYVTNSLTSDQVTINATVPQAFSFALAGSPDSIGSLSSGSVAQSTGVTATINTNAANGYEIYARDQYAGLNSASASKTIAAANGPLSAGTEGYNLGVTVSQTSGSGTPAGVAPFVGGAAGTGGALSNTALSKIGSSNGTANNAVFTLKSSAAISATTQAASDYTDVVTVVAAALF